MTRQRNDDKVWGWTASVEVMDGVTHQYPQIAYFGMKIPSNSSGILYSVSPQASGRPFSQWSRLYKNPSFQPFSVDSPPSSWRGVSHALQSSRRSSYSQIQLCPPWRTGRPHALLQDAWPHFSEAVKISGPVITPCF